MILWFLVFFALAGAALVNFYQGAFRGVFSTLGLLMAGLLALPFSVVVKPLLPVVGVSHPVIASFIAPVVVWILILAAFKVAGFALSKKISTHYKYHDSDTQRLLFERMNQRVGIAVGLMNGALYLYTAFTAVSILGYFTTQVASPGRDTFMLKMVNWFHQSAEENGVNQAVAPFARRAASYYYAADILGLIYRNPLAQSRLSSYPVFLTLAEKPEFQAISTDVDLQEMWQREPPPTIHELIRHPRIEPLVKSPELYKEAVALLGPDIRDLKGYLESGKSDKYEDDKILGRWNFNSRQSYSRTRATRANWTTVELTALKNLLGNVWQNATFRATVDHKAVVRLPGTGKTIEGTWKSITTSRYTLQLQENGKATDVEALVEGRKVIFAKDGVSMVFEK